MPKFNVSLSIGHPNATRKDVIEINEEEWVNCETDSDREALIDSYTQEWAWNYIEISAVPVE